MTRSAFIAIIGKPNVGKSSILNRLTGSKIAIVSSKPQTTRTKIMGVLTRDEVQLVFTDTPGFHHAHNKLGEHMNQAVGDTVGGVDACLFVVEPKGELNDKEQELLAMCKKQRLPVILAINKIDMLRDKTELAPRIGCGALQCPDRRGYAGSADGDGTPGVAVTPFFPGRYLNGSAGAGAGGGNDSGEDPAPNG